MGATPQTAGSTGKRGEGKVRKRPRVVTLLAVILIVSSVFALLGAVTALGLDALYHVAGLSLDTAQKVKVDETALLVDGALLLLSGVVELVVGVGAFRLADWAWPAAVALAVFDIVTRLWTLAIDDFSWPVAIGASIAVVVLFYLQQEDVKRAFGR